MNHTITVYRKHGTWCFTDSGVGLIDEPFVDGADRIIDVAAGSLVDAGLRPVRLRISFSAGPGLFWNLKRFGRKVRGGYRYRLVGDSPTRIEGWLCPALFKYFDVAPKYVSFKVAVLATEPA